MRHETQPSRQDIVRPWLEPDEELLWTGHPDPLCAARNYIGTAVSGLVTILLVSLSPLSRYLSSASFSSSDLASLNNVDVHFLKALPVLFALAGLVLFFSPALSYLCARWTVYAVTGRRALAVQKGMFGSSVRAVRLDAVDTPLLNLGSRGTGDISFSCKDLIADAGDGRSLLTHFTGVRDAEQVYRMIRGRIPRPDEGRGAGKAIQDYLEILAQGKRTLDDTRDR